MDSSLKLKERILDELLEDLDTQEGAKLKPVAKVSMTSVKPADKTALFDAMGKSDDEDENPDDLKQLLQEYLSER